MGALVLASQAFGSKEYKLMGMVVYKTVAIGIFLLVITIPAAFYLDKILQFIGINEEMSKLT